MFFQKQRDTEKWKKIISKYKNYNNEHIVSSLINFKEPRIRLLLKIRLSQYVICKYVVPIIKQKLLQIIKKMNLKTNSKVIKYPKQKEKKRG